MQGVCSQRMSVPFTSDPVELYRSIRHLNPSPYLYYLNLEDFHIVGSSPEILARLEDGEVTVRPIAGTRRRGEDEQDDLDMEKDMINDPKEIAKFIEDKVKEIKAEGAQNTNKNKTPSTGDVSPKTSTKVSK